jgi:hypothetical protein
MVMGDIWKCQIFVSGLNNVCRKNLMKVLSTEFPALLCYYLNNNVESKIVMKKKAFMSVLAAFKCL